MDGGLGIALNPLVPGIGGSDGDVLTTLGGANNRADLVDGLAELVALQFLTVHVLGSNGDTDNVFETVLWKNPTSTVSNQSLLHHPQ